MKKKIRKILTVCISICLILAIFVAFANIYVITYSNKYFYTLDELKDQDFDCIIILGAGLWSGRPSPMLQERLDFGIEAFGTGCTERIIMSGDHGTENYDEVNTMKEVAVDEGIDPDCIYLDHAGFSTYESVYRARDIFKVKKVLIITQKYHLYRAVYDARKLGLDAYGMPAEKKIYPIYNDMREAAARVKDFIWCIVKPEPTCLGDEIPILEVDASETDG